MAITQDAERQYALTVDIPFTYADFTSGTAAAALDVPENAFVVGGYFVIDTAFNSATSDTITVGDGVSANRYASGVNGQTAAATALTLTGYKYTADDTIDITWTGAGTAPTAGAGRLVVQYAIDGRANERQE